MTTAQRITAVLDQLRKNLGTGEKPPGSNHNFITEWYNKNVARIGDGPWCEMTNTWAMWTGGAKQLKRGRAYTVYAARDAIAKVNGSSWHWGTKGMRAGDQVYYDWTRKKGNEAYVDHTGTVERILGDGTFYVLEGNTSGNKLQRMRRDSKYVVGYVRFDWDRLEDPKPKAKPKPSTKPVTNSKRTPTQIAHVKNWQKHLEVEADGRWGPSTDAVATRMRNASQAKAGFPQKINRGFSIGHVQNVIDSKIDGVWGPESQRHLEGWIKHSQRLLGVPMDGEWGPRTDNAFLKFRKENFGAY